MYYLREEILNLLQGTSKKLQWHVAAAGELIMQLPFSKSRTIRGSNEGKAPRVGVYRKTDKDDKSQTREDR